MVSDRDCTILSRTPFDAFLVTFDG